MEHRFDNLLKEIIGIVRSDYAGFEEKESRHDARYFVTAAGTAWKRGELDELLFLQLVCQYLASLDDPCLKFSMLDHAGYRNYDVGFRARRYGDYLYVTESYAEDRVKPGDMITVINSLAPGVHRKKMVKNLFIGETAEREQWGNLLKMAKHCVVEHADGTKEDLVLRHYPVSAGSAGRAAAAPSFSVPAKGVCCIRVERFEAGAQELLELLSAHAQELASCEKLIIDIRKNSGGTDDGFVPLLPFVMDHPYRPEEVLDAEPVLRNYSAGNCSRRIGEFKRLKGQFDLKEDADTLAVLEELIREFQEKSGTGWRREGPSGEALPEETETGTARQEQPGTDHPGKEPDPADVPAAEAAPPAAGDPVSPYDNIRSVLVITDTWCRDSGETFADIARKSSKVRLFGRPTMGTIDYTDYVNVVLDDTYVLSYPMAKKARVADGERYNESGIPVDIYRPWTPAECTEDTLLERALTYL